MMRTLAVLSALTIAVTLATPSLAQNAPPSKHTRPEERRTIIDMEADVIEGNLRVPDHILVNEHGRRSFGTLIRVRTEFRREVLASIERM